MSPSDLVFQLRGTCNSYDWGKKGKESLAARLCSHTLGSDFTIEDDQYYSEMWFGDYPNFPARVLETGELLSDRIYNNSALLGEGAVRKCGGHLPFLPKILSIAKALPLQIHPNKKLASKLHRGEPDRFTDSNHKPEIAIALSEFKAFVGWRTLEEIAEIFSIAALNTFVPEGVSSWTDQTLREVVGNVLHADSTVLRHSLEALERTPRGDLGKSDYVLDLLPILTDQYGLHDPGVLVAPLCMNFLVLQPGDAVFIPADGIHAYISGDIFECMARSDNMLASGLESAPVEKSTVDAFVYTMIFQGCFKKDVELSSTDSRRGKNGRTTSYNPPIEEFEVLVTELGANDEEVIVGDDGAGISIVINGGGTLEWEGKKVEVEEGHIYFISAGTDVKWVGGKDALKIFTAVA